MKIDDEIAHAAVEARDRRFDGLFFLGVTSTGIYCRCVCPARTPKRQNRRIYSTAAAAERDGFRPASFADRSERLDRRPSTRPSAWRTTR